MNDISTICAIATAPGGAIGLIRISGPEAIAIASRVFVPHRGAPLADRRPHSLTFGLLTDAQGETIDEGLAAIFRAPQSYTGEDAVEFSLHGSPYILQTAIQRLLDEGCQPAAPGEFTQRAFLNGRLDLSQAEAVAEVIASTTAAQHRVAMAQMRGSFSRRLAELRDQLLHLTALLELELDFADHEDLEFADRTQLTAIAAEIASVTQRLADSFATGNVLKHGLPVAIVGSTNAGKSTLLNALLHDERAIVSDIHGTTRDVIEDTYTIGGTLFRLIDTAGLRATTDTVEQMGIERSWQKLAQAQIVLFMVDSTDASAQLAALAPRIAEMGSEAQLIVVFNKSDLAQVDAQALAAEHFGHLRHCAALSISARTGHALDDLRQLLVDTAQQHTAHEGELVVTNARHYAALRAALADIERVQQGLAAQLSGDLVAQDLRECLFHLAEITGGAITSDEVLGTIFKHFCIGK
ncbi:MAG: tRNA uridine-5-carboxymethylaminomethyl(34) synthesis GTPase MnmE [Bacteroidaceae bacterium]|nr:tRNA uridine-5-carboxymethylaminomethyl(34) synthesis GTPase MnmE [Bacteroidaceae bacterium]